MKTVHWLLDRWCWAKDMVLLLNPPEQRWSVLAMLLSAPKHLPQTLTHQTPSTLGSKRPCLSPAPVRQTGQAKAPCLFLYAKEWAACLSCASLAHAIKTVLAPGSAAPLEHSYSINSATEILAQNKSLSHS